MRPARIIGALIGALLFLALVLAAVGCAAPCPDHARRLRTEQGKVVVWCQP